MMNPMKFESKPQMVGNKGYLISFGIEQFSDTSQYLGFTFIKSEPFWVIG